MSSRKVAKHSQKWATQVNHAGGKQQFLKGLTPKAVQKSARRSFVAKAKRWSNPEAKGKSGTGNSGTTGTKASGGAAWSGAVQWFPVADHQLLNKAIAGCMQRNGALLSDRHVLTNV